MSKLFRKQKAKKQSKLYLLQGLRRRWNKQLRKIASYLSDKAQRVPEQQLAWILISACLITAFVLSCKLFYSFKYKNQIEFHSISASVVKSTYLAPVDDVFGRIKKFHHYLDSLKKNDLPLYDSIIVKRPHLMDSLITIEEYTNQ